MRQTVLTTIVFAALDAVWLGVAMNGFYKSELGSLARLSGSNFAPVWWAACVVYALLVVGLVVFVLPRATGQPARALGFGALFGGVAYGTYDFTAYAVLAGWSLRMTLVDLWWGAVICGLSAAVVTVVESRLALGPGLSSITSPAPLLSPAGTRLSPRSATAGRAVLTFHPCPPNTGAAGSLRSNAVENA